MTFLGLFPPFATAVFRTGFFVPLDAGFPVLRAALMVLLAASAALATGLDLPPVVFLGPLAAPAFLSGRGSTAPIAARIRLISRVTCSMVIMPSSVHSLPSYGTSRIILY